MSLNEQSNTDAMGKFFTLPSAANRVCGVGAMAAASCHGANSTYNHCELPQAVRIQQNTHMALANTTREFVNRS